MAAEPGGVVGAESVRGAAPVVLGARLPAARAVGEHWGQAGGVWGRGDGAAPKAPCLAHGHEQPHSTQFWHQERAKRANPTRSRSGQDEPAAHSPLFLGTDPPRAVPSSVLSLRDLTVGVKMHVLLHAHAVVPGAVGRGVCGVSLRGVPLGLQPPAPLLPRGHGQPHGDDAQLAVVAGTR